jgi:hypothetical protein
MTRRTAENFVPCIRDGQFFLASLLRRPPLDQSSRKCSRARTRSQSIAKYLARRIQQRQCLAQSRKHLHRRSERIRRMARTVPRQPQLNSRNGFWQRDRRVMAFRRRCYFKHFGAALTRSWGPSKLLMKSLPCCIKHDCLAACNGVRRHARALPDK